MSWPHYKPIVTVADVLESGACYDGVCEWVKSHGGIISGRASEHSHENILKAAWADGYGDGYGYGSGSGYGDGDGDGVIILGGRTMPEIGKNQLIILPHG